MSGPSPGMVFGNALIGGCGPFVSTVAATIAAGVAWTPASLGAALKAWYKADAGVLARTAAQFTAASSEYLSLTTPISLPDNTPWTISGWFYLDAISTSGLFGYDYSAGKYSRLYVASTTQMAMFNDANGNFNLSAGTAMSLGAWYHLIITCDGSGTGAIVVYLNNASWATGSIADSSFTFQVLGSYGVGGGGTLTGRLANWAVWNGTALGASDRAALYNGGVGVRYADWTGTAPTAWWELDENSGVRAAKVGAALTDNNTVTANDGKVSYAAADGDAVWSMDDADDDFGDLLQTTFANRLTYRTDLGRGRLRSTGVSEFMSIASVTLAQPFTLAVVYKSASAGAVYEMAVSGTPGSTPGIFKRNDDKFVIGAPTEAVAANSDTVLHSHIVCFSGASSTYHLDGVAQSLSANPGTDDWSAEALSIMGKSDGGNPMDGDFCELVAVSGVLSDADRANLQTYLKNRWGTP